MFTLFKEVENGESIKYYDVTSLYPFINKTGTIPLGHPIIITVCKPYQVQGSSSKGFTYTFENQWKASVPFV